jgi:SAM-dependent methyltransferase
MVTEARLRSNEWIARHAEEITGKVLSIGSGDDYDWCGKKYRSYFKNASLYLTSDITHKCDLVVDARDMKDIEDDAFDCLICMGTIEHIDDMFKAMSEMARVLKPGGVLLFGAPFGYKIHQQPMDFWRMTIYGLRYLIERFGFEEEDMVTFPGPIKGFDACYLAKARRKTE